MNILMSSRATHGATRQKFKNHFVDAAKMVAPKIVRREWPLAIRWMLLFARPEDKGLGDIVARLIGPIGGDAYKAWYEKVFGKKCGCSARQDRLNEQYPI